MKGRNTMAIRKGQVVRVVEGRKTLVALAREVRTRSEKTGFQFSYVDGDALQVTAFDPSGEVLETSEVITILGSEYGSPIPARVVIFKDDRLDSEIGPLVVA